MGEDVRSAPRPCNQRQGRVSEWGSAVGEAHQAADAWAGGAHPAQPGRRCNQTRQRGIVPQGACEDRLVPANRPIETCPVRLASRASTGESRAPWPSGFTAPAVRSPNRAGRRGWRPGPPRGAAARGAPAGRRRGDHRRSRCLVQHEPGRDRPSHRQDAEVLPVPRLNREPIDQAVHRYSRLRARWATRARSSRADRGARRMNQFRVPSTSCSPITSKPNRS